MRNNLGGTNILKPLSLAQELESEGRKKRIFLLTDGEVYNGDEILE